MDKKTMYYVVAGAVLVLVIGIIIAMQNQPEVSEPIVQNQPAAEEPKKSEGELNKDIAQKLNLSDGELPLRVTIDDNGQSASLTPGKNITLMLGAEYDWTISSSNGAVLSKRAITLDDARVQAVYQVVGEGTAVLSAQGKCKTGAECVAADAQFVFNVEAVVSENIAPEDLVK